MLAGKKDRIELVVVSGAWPTGSTGYGIAVQAALRVYAEYFNTIHFFGPAAEPFNGGPEWDGKNIRWIPLPFIKGSLWVRFLRSIVSKEPAITVRYRAALSTFRNEIAGIVHKSKARNNSVGIIYLDLPTSSLLPKVRYDFPQITQAVYSLNTVGEGFSGLSHQGPFYRRLAWRIELAKIRKWEERIYTIADAFWTISAADNAIYRERLHIIPDGVFGISLNCDRYASVKSGEHNTVVHVGGADLIKGMGLQSFLQDSWPTVRDQVPDARLVLAGRGTERFTDASLDVRGLGYVEDDRDVLSQGSIFVNPQQIGSGIQLKSVVAMLAGKTLVSTALAVKGVEGKDGEHFIVAEPGGDMASKIVSLIRDSPRANRIAENGRALAAQTYSHENLLQVTKPLLDAFIYRSASRKYTSNTRRYQVCTNCVMDTTDSSITFDDKGVCDHCRNYYAKILPNWHTDEKGWQALQKIADRIKKEGVGKDFDCIIGMSGGIDSSYLTFVAKEMLGLRPLVFHVDAGWNSQTAVNNIEKLVDKLGLDLFTEVIDWEEMRDLQLAFFKSGVPHIDAPQDHAFFAEMYKFAEKYNVKTILTGANISTECVRNPIEWMYYQSDSTQLLDIHEKFGARPLFNFPLTSILRHKVYLKYIKGIRVETPLNYIPYQKTDAMAFLTERFGWQAYSQKHFESRFTQFYEGYWLPIKFGYDTRKVQYSSLILTNQMTREEALQQLSKPSFDEDSIVHEFEYVASKLGISVDELQGYMDGPNRTYRDYRSQHTVYLIGAKLMRLLRLELGGKR